MFLQKKKATILLTRSGLQVFIPNRANPLVISFPVTLIHNLELIDQIGFEKYLDQFCKQNKIDHLTCTLVLDESFLFWKKYLSGETVGLDFFDLVPLPLDQQVHKQIQIDTNILLAVHNSAILSSIQRALHNNKNAILSILPFFAFPGFDNGKVDVMNGDVSSIRRISRYDSEILQFKSTSPLMSTPAVMTITSLVVLLLIGIGLYLRYFYQPKKIEKVVVKEIKKMPSPTPTIIFLNPKDITMEIKNGSGRFGEAGRLKTTLEKENYTITAIGNADVDVQETEVAARITVPHDYIASLSAILKEHYSMSSNSATIPESTSSADIILTIGKDLVR